VRVKGDHGSQFVEQLGRYHNEPLSEQRRIRRSLPNRGKKNILGGNRGSGPGRQEKFEERTEGDLDLVEGVRVSVAKKNHWFGAQVPGAGCASGLCGGGESKPGPRVQWASLQTEDLKGIQERRNRKTEEVDRGT